MNRRMLQIGFAWVALVAAGVGIGIWPAWRNLTNAGQQIRMGRAALAAASDSPALLERRVETMSRLREFSGAHTKSIPVDGDIAGFVRGLVTWLDEADVTEREIATGASARENDIWAAPMSLTMTAGFEDVFATLEYIESLPRLVRVSRLKLTRQPNGLLRAEFSLDVLFTGRDTSVASAEGSRP